MTSREM